MIPIRKIHPRMPFPPPVTGIEVGRRAGRFRRWYGTRSRAPVSGFGRTRLRSGDRRSGSARERADEDDPVLAVRLVIGECRGPVQVLAAGAVVRSEAKGAEERDRDRVARPGQAVTVRAPPAAVSARNDSIMARPTPPGDDSDGRPRGGGPPRPGGPGSGSRSGSRSGRPSVLGDPRGGGDVPEPRPDDEVADAPTAEPLIHEGDEPRLIGLGRMRAGPRLIAMPPPPARRRRGTRGRRAVRPGPRGSRRSDPGPRPRSGRTARSRAGPGPRLRGRRSPPGRAARRTPDQPADEGGEDDQAGGDGQDGAEDDEGERVPRTRASTTDRVQRPARSRGARRAPAGSARSGAVEAGRALAGLVAGSSPGHRIGSAPRPVAATFGDIPQAGPRRRSRAGAHADRAAVDCRT